MCRTLVKPRRAPLVLGGDDVLEGGGAFAQEEWRRGSSGWSRQRVRSSAGRVKVTMK